jgi:hypothetical protein
MMVRKDVIVDTSVRLDDGRYAGPEISAEKAEQKIFEEARQQGRVISDVRTRIDRSE